MADLIILDYIRLSCFVEVIWSFPCFEFVAFANEHQEQFEWGLRPFHPGLCHFFFWRKKALLGFFAGEGSNLPATCPARIGDWEVALAFGDGVGTTLDYESPEKTLLIFVWVCSGSQARVSILCCYSASSLLFSGKQTEREGAVPQTTKPS